MLQQTQVTTVIPYYERFMASFPDVEALANAEQDAVLHHWTGLGYYARARNLHKTARIVSSEWQGEFPTSVDELETLPGIGRSTAGAIHAISRNKRAVILDGNVKRVLARLHRVEGWYGHTSVAKVLWELADAMTPPKRSADYTQAIMDLGATLCTRSKPRCEDCPVQSQCSAYENAEVSAYPHARPRKVKPVKRTQMLLIQNEHGEFYLEKRPQSGIWGGLWSLPEVTEGIDASAAASTLIGQEAELAERLGELRHTFSHYHLDIEPVLLRLTDPRPQTATRSMEADRQLWYNIDKPASIGLAAPVKRLLLSLPDEISQRTLL